MPTSRAPWSRNARIDPRRATAAVNYVFGLIYGLLAIRFVFALIAARSGNGFVRVIEKITDPFYNMFCGIVPSASVDGRLTVVVPILIAIVAYALLHAAIDRFLRMTAERTTTT